MSESIVCKACNKRVNIGDLRADRSGSGWICVNCYQDQHPNVYKPESKEPKSRTEQITKKLNQIKYYCTNCGYKFYKEEKFSGKCPYCSLYSVREEKDAETWLREVTNEEEEKTERNERVEKANNRASRKIEILD